MGASSDSECRSPIVFFDGVCGFCDQFIQFLLQADRAGILRVATLQSATAAKLIGPELKNLTTILVCDPQGRILSKSTAVIYIFENLGGMWALIGRVVRIFPRFIRDAIYDFVAKHRYKIFGKLDVCRMPTAAERQRFLD